MEAIGLISKIDLSNVEPLVAMGGESDGEGRDKTDRSSSSSDEDSTSLWVALLNLFGL